MIHQSFFPYLSKIIIFILVYSFFISDCSASLIKAIENKGNLDKSIHTCASLLFHLRMKTGLSIDEKPIFTKEEVANLWDRLEEYQPRANYIRSIYYEAENSNTIQQASLLYHQTFNRLSTIWERSIAYEEAKHPFYLINQTARSNKNEDFERNLAIPDDVKKHLRPYVIPEIHPMKKNLDEMFFAARMTQDVQTFRHYGFKTLRIGPRSYVHVASHANLPSYLVKAYMDNELKEKGKHPSWHWLVKRCEGAKKIRKIIDQQNLQHFTVASKWIYPFPENPPPPPFPGYTRHYALLLVKDMQLVPKRKNYDAWSQVITKSHLDELYIIISRAKGSSYRPDNIAYTTNGNFAFIDTEYPSRGPDYSSIRRYLNEEMQEYWDFLITTGGE
ncbi:MAG: hypothetical protein H0V82_11170 [Candidatus Protochlamydia sp.]|nr:hypothetical protein [Candidatus Protochlamydia sp.]